MLAGLRSGTIDYIGWQGAAQLNTVDQAESLRRTNPELVLVPWVGTVEQRYAHERDQTAL